MQYYIFDAVSPNDDAPFLELPEEIDLIESIMGKKPDFYELPIEIQAEIDEGEEVVYTDIINPGVPLFSEKMKSSLDELGVDNIDYYPVVIVEWETKEVLANYWLAIVKDLIACIDLENSEISKNASGREIITKFAVDHTKTTGSNLFRFHHIPGLVIINDDLKEKLSKIEFTGVRFQHTNEYTRDV